MEVPIPEIFKYLWSEWEIRIAVLCSLLLQMLLIFLAPFRKRSASRCIRLMLWSFYLLADWVAVFSLGLLSNNQGDSAGASTSNAISTASTSASSSRRSSGSNDANNVVQAFWAPFLLLHLGGPDTITAFSLEDNELWLRHLLGLGFQLYVAGYVFFRSLPNESLLAPTIIMFVIGGIKYTERTYSLYSASMDGFRDSVLTKADPGPNYAKLMVEYDSKLKAHLKADISVDEPRFIDVEEERKDKKETSKEEAPLRAYGFFDKFRCLFVDLILSFKERSESQKFFMQQKPVGAFRVVEAELNFVYDQLYTKAAIIHSRIGYALRVFCSVALLVTFLLFFFSAKENHFDPIDVGIAYALLGGAIFLDGVAAVMLVLSDWTTVFLEQSTSKLQNLPLLKWISKLQQRLAWIVTKLEGRRWSEKMCQLSLIGFCLTISPNKRLRRLKCIPCLHKLSEKLCFEEMLDELLYTSRESVPTLLMETTYAKLMKKAEDAKSYKGIREVCEQKGGRQLLKVGFRSKEKADEMEFDESLLLWHIATDLCYHSEDPRETNENKLHSKMLSRYMLYLLKMQPAMMSAMAGIGLIRYRDTCAELQRFVKMTDVKLQMHQACKMLMEVNTKVEPAKVKGDRSKSVLFDAVILAKKLRDKDFEERWEVILDAWQELLSYAASHCRGNAHSRQLSRGGELITLVWLAMAHLGLGDQYRIEAGHASAKLVVDK